MALSIGSDAFIIVTPEPFTERRSTGFEIIKFSLYVPSPTRIMSPVEAASTAS